MKKIAFTFATFLATAAVLAPAAVAAQLHANVVAWTPSDVTAGESVSIVLQLYTAGVSAYPKDGTPVAGVSDVDVVISGGGSTRNFPTEELGSGRYRAEIVFPNNGGWDLRVRYGPGSYGTGDEIQLGKGAICIGAAPCGPAPLQLEDNVAPAPSRVREWTMLFVAFAVLLVAGVGGVGFMLFRGRARRRFTAADATAKPAPTASSPS